MSSRTAKPLPFAALLAPLLLFLLGLYAVQFGVRQLWAEHVAGSWPHANAVITGAAVVEFDSRVGPKWRPGWSYEFTVEGRPYTGDHEVLVGTTPSTSRRAMAEANLARHPVGSQVLVVYEPGNPVNVALQISVDDSLWWVLIGGGALFVLIGVLCGMAYARMRAGARFSDSSALA
ncbi:MAG: DUF3592 domain-containing protein [Pseudomonadota bacterium]